MAILVYTNILSYNCCVYTYMYEMDTEEEVQETDDVQEKNQTPKVSHGDAEQAFDFVLRYMEQEMEFSTDPCDIMFLRRGRDFAHSKKLQSFKIQKK